MSNKISFEQLVSYIKTTGCKPNFTKEWFFYNSRHIHSTKLNLICKCGKLFSIDYNSFIKEEIWYCHDCLNIQNKYANIITILESKKYKSDFTKEWFYDNYKSDYTPLKFICVNCGASFEYNYFKIKKNKAKSICDNCSIIKKGNVGCNKDIIVKPVDFEENILYELKIYISDKKNISNLSVDCPEIYNHINGTKKGYYIKYLDMIYGEDYDYSYILEKTPVQFWNESRILSILKKMYDKHHIINLRLHPFHKSLTDAIQKKGLDYYLNLLGYKREEVCYYVEDGYWKVWKHIEEEMQKAIDLNNGKFPSCAFVYSISKLNSNILKPWGGFESVRRKLGYDKIDYKANDGHYLRSFLEVIVDNILYLNKIPHYYDKVITEDNKEKYRYDFYCYKHDFYIEIWGLDNGSSKRGKEYNKKKEKKKKLYSKLKYNLIEINEKDFNHNFKETLEILYTKLKVLFDNPVKTKDIDLIIPEYKINFKNFLDTIKPYMPYNDCLPSYVELREQGRNDIVKFIAKFGGVRSIADKFGLKTKGDYYHVHKNENNNDFIINELKNIYEKEGLLPTYSNIKKTNSKLYYEIKNKGGYNLIATEFQSIIGQPIKLMIGKYKYKIIDNKKINE